jgi:hypothetical protein
VEVTGSDKHTRLNQLLIIKIISFIAQPPPPGRHRRKVKLMEKRTSKIANNGFNTNIYSYLEISGGQSLNQYLKVVHFFNTSAD